MKKNGIKVLTDQCTSAVLPICEKNEKGVKVFTDQCGSGVLLICEKNGNGIKVITDQCGSASTVVYSGLSLTQQKTKPWMRESLNRRLTNKI